MTIRHVRSGSRDILLLAPLKRTDSRKQIAAEIDRIGPERLLIASFSESAHEWYTAMYDQIASQPAHLGYIEIGMGTASEPTERKGSYDQFEYLETVKDGGNLTRLGVKISSCLDQWKNSEDTILLYIDSLTLIAHHVSEPALTRFIQALKVTLNEVDANGLYRLDPNAHDEQLVTKLEHLIDGVIDFRDT